MFLWSSRSLHSQNYGFYLFCLSEMVSRGENVCQSRAYAVECPLERDKNNIYDSRPYKLNCISCSHNPRFGGMSFIEDNEDALISINQSRQLIGEWMRGNVSTSQGEGDPNRVSTQNSLYFVFNKSEKDACFCVDHKKCIYKC